MTPEAPGPGEWVTTERGVRVRMPEVTGSPYIRLDWRQGGRRLQTTCGRAEDWPRAWALAQSLDATLATEELLDAAASAAHGGRRRSRRAPGQLTVAQVADRFLEARGRTWALTYDEANRSKLARLVLPALGRLPVTDLTREDVRRLISAQGNASARASLRALLSSMLNWAEQEGLIERSARSLLPSAAEVVPAPRQAATIPAGRPWDGRIPDDVDEEDIEDHPHFVPVRMAPATHDVLAADKWIRQPRVSGHPHSHPYLAPAHFRLMFLIAGFCGLRQGEIWGLRGRHVGDRVIHVRQQLQWIAGQPMFLPPKNRRPRDVAVPREVQGLRLWELLVERAKEVGPDGLLLPTSTGMLWRRGNFTRDVMNPLRQQGPWQGQTWTFHSLRHHYCRWLLDQGVSATRVAAMAGHSTVMVTLSMYVNPEASDLQAVLDHFERQEPGAGMPSG